LELARVVDREAQPREVCEEARSRVGEARRVVPDGPEIIGASHERAASTHRSNPAIREIKPCRARVAMGQGTSERRSCRRHANERDLLHAVLHANPSLSSGRRRSIARASRATDETLETWVRVATRPKRC